VSTKRSASTTSSRSRVRIFAAVAVLAVGPAAVAAGCSLGLDPSKIGQDAGTDTVVVGVDDGPSTTDGMPQSKDGGLVVAAGACQSDMDCQNAAAPAGACVTSAKCDPTWHVCMLDTCDVGSCKAAVCNTATKTCSVPTTFGWSAASFAVGYGGVGGNGPRSSISAAWPFVFVITTNGVVAYNVVDPTNTSPPLVPVDGLPFFPQWTVTVGRRVYFVRNVEGSGPSTYRQAIGWVDVPQNPFVASFEAKTAFVTTSQTSINAVYSDQQDGIYLVYGSGMLYPTINLHPPIDDTTTLAPVPNAGLASGASLVAASGSRLVAYRYDGFMQVPNFALVTNAGTSGAQTTGEQPIGQYGALANQYFFTMGDDGTVLWETALLAPADAGGGISTARLVWPVTGPMQTNFDPTTYVDLQTFSPPTGSLVVGPPAWIDANTVLALSAAGSLSTNSTAVQVAVKGAPGGNPPASLVPGARVTLPVDPGSVGVASSNGFGYVLQQDDPKNTSATVAIFAPACAGDH
jgi:hypothetical protein